MNAYQFAKKAAETLNKTNGPNWAEVFVKLRQEFFQKYQKPKILTTEFTGPSFFHDFVNHVNPIGLKGECSEYQKNYLTLIHEAQKEFLDSVKTV